MSTRDITCINIQARTYMPLTFLNFLFDPPYYYYIRLSYYSTRLSYYYIRYSTGALGAPKPRNLLHAT